MNLFHRSACCSLAVALSAPCFAQRGPVPGFSSATPYLIHYGNWDSTLITQARTNYKLVILHPSASNITAANIATIRSGPDSTVGTSDDVKVIAYISVGEDDRPGAPFPGEGNGPRVDPRPSNATPLESITDPLGQASPGGTGYASYYLDDVDQDGQPDQNAVFGGYYVNPGDPAWYQILKNKTKVGSQRAGILELLTTTTGNGYNCDGLFLDTLDTPAPDSFGGTSFEWTTEAYRDLVKQISDDHPAKLLMANRGVFFYNPNLKSYAYTLRPYINMLMFESYYTDSSGSGMETAFFDDNKFNFAPKINAEANRPDGFTVVSLGYTSSGEPPSLIAQDFIESQQQQGWLLYRTNPALNALPFNTQAATWNAANPDTAPPVWDSTAAPGADSFPEEFGNQPPAPRIGVQQVATSDGTATVRWDVARDQTGPVKYHIYYTTEAVLNFATATKLANVAPAVPESYQSGAGAGRFPYEFTLTGLTNGTAYRFAVRAEDALGHEDTNDVVIAATPQPNPSGYREVTIDGAFTDWDGAPVLDADPAEATPVDFANVQVANDANYLYVRFTLHAGASPFSDFNTHLFLDTDNNPATGLPVSGAGIGSEVMVETGTAYDQRGGGFNEGGVNGVAWSISPAGPATAFELRFSRSATFVNGGAPVFGGNTIRLALQDNRGDTTAGILLDFAASPPPPSNYAAINVDGNSADWAGIPVTGTDPTGDSIPDIASVKVANDADYLYVLVQYNGAVDTNTLNGSPSTFLSLDNDANAGTGFNIYGLGQVGAEVSWQNDFPFAQDAATYNRGAVFTNGAAGISPYFANTTFQEYRIARNATYSIGGGPQQPVFPNNSIKLALWSDHGVSAEFAGAVNYTFAAAPVAGNFAPITVDGTFTDWAGIPVRASRASSGADMDWATLQLANDGQYLYGRFTLHAAPAAPPFSESQTNLFLDTDNNPATGFVPGSSGFGSSLMIQGGTGYDQRGGGFNEGTASDLGWLIAGSGTEWEFRVSRTAAYAGAVPVFANGTIRLMLQDDRPTTPGTMLPTAGVSYTFQTNPDAAIYEAWRAAEFTAPELANLLISGDNADPDHDGTANLLEFALGLLPKTSDPEGLPDGALMSIGPDRFLTFTYIRRPLTDGVTFTPQTSSDLGTWNSDQSQFTPLSTTPLGGNLTEVKIRLNTPLPAGPKFVRLQAILAP
ncbi:fibronectin type III domain-containing protein [Luteolibacter arcticus]|uniref:Fibronectin type III domain-containing protein n=1 Tax=Luteolibacter arcticus TaxID=1581411 RepID=A0ABT3GE48_9BACT|nr:fibronectin type III domain-containing protein [Luteolibacter arcticus]MCW1921900.1 fibronectin type III domain-containing protein [Luteolibacter arcticus]